MSHTSSQSCKQCTLRFAFSCVTSLAHIQDPLETSVITCGTIKGGSNFNIIADNVEIVGTTRSFTREAQQLIKSRMNCVCCGVAKTFGGQVDVLYEGVYSFLPLTSSILNSLHVR